MMAGLGSLNPPYELNATIVTRKMPVGSRRIRARAAKAAVQDTGRYHNDPVFRAAADAAHRALMNPRCQPWPLPSDRYNGWRTITFNFDPRDY